MHQKLRNWFNKNKRDLPFRQEKNPYSVWISEVMLQQTRVEAVIPFFMTWIKRFPDVEALANSSLESVIKCWEGLGYYSRARNLHLGAKQIMQDFQGKIPNSLNDLLQIQGIGPYTARAILSFAFHEKIAPVDGNVTRVISRLYAIDALMEKASTKQRVQEYADRLLPDQRPFEVAESIIELGALVCKTEKPKCMICPVKKDCKAHATKSAHLFPKRKQRVQVQQVEKSAAIFIYQDQILVTKHPKGLMQDLHEFPTVNGKKNASDLLKAFGFSARFIKKLDRVSSFYTKYKQNLYGYVFELEQSIALEKHHFFISKMKIFDLPFSSGHRKILKHL